MAAAITLTLGQTQSMRMSAAQTQSLKLLQTPYIELWQALQEALLQNPYLEMEAHDSIPEPLSFVALASSHAPRDSLRLGERSSPGSEISQEGITNEDVTHNDHVWRHERDFLQPRDPPQDWALNPSLHTHLLEQAASLRLSATERRYVEACIASLDEEGYLRDADDWAVGLSQEDGLSQTQPHQLGIHPEGQEQDRPSDEEQAHLACLALRLVQSMDPPGVGARDLAECLQLQLQRLEQEAKLQDARVQFAQAQEGSAGEIASLCTINWQDRLQLIQLAKRLCAGDLLALSQRRWAALARTLGVESAQVQAAGELVRRLQPRPALAFRDGRTQLRVAELEIYYDTRAKRWRARSLNPLTLRLNEARIAQWRLQKQVDEARWWCRALAQREATLCAIGQAIATLQADFFRHGSLALKPMGLADIAAAIGMHESTVSRAIEGKYLECPQGVLALRYFLSSALRRRAYPSPASRGTHGDALAAPSMPSTTRQEAHSRLNANGSMATLPSPLLERNNAPLSSHQVRALMAEMLAHESPQKPLSDQQIADRLQQKGIVCARRTVAKYRDMMGVLPAALRKKN